MKSRLSVVLSLAAALAIAGGFALAQAPTPAQVQVIGPTDLFPDVVNGTPQPNSQYVSGANLIASVGGYGENYLIGGDPSTNLFQRSVAAAAVTGGTGATVVYTADRWANWEAVAGSTANATIKATTAATLGPGASASMLFKLTNSQTGTAQVCTAQEISNLNSLPLAGHTVEVDMNAYAGATFTGTGINIYVITGTDAGGDNGTADLAFGLNANSVSGTAWAGQTNQTVGLFPMSVSTMYRPMAVANIPAAATEVAVAVCFTPSGTSSGTGGTDGVYLSNIELRKADSLSNWVNTATAYSINTSTNVATATIGGTARNVAVPLFARRSATNEQTLQLAYAVSFLDGPAVAPIGTGVYYTTTECDVHIPFPVPMRAAPTVSFLGKSLDNTTFAVIGAAGGATPTALATDYLAQGLGANTTIMGDLEATTAGTTAGWGCLLTGAATATTATILFSAEL